MVHFSCSQIWISGRPVKKCKCYHWAIPSPWLRLVVSLSQTILTQAKLIYLVTWSIFVVEKPNLKLSSRPAEKKRFQLPPGGRTRRTRRRRSRRRRTRRRWTSRRTETRTTRSVISCLIGATTFVRMRHVRNTQAWTLTVLNKPWPFHTSNPLLGHSKWVCRGLYR